MGLTAISIYAPGDTIASAWANILRTNFNVVDTRTGGDPGAALKTLVSDGAASGIWLAGLTSAYLAAGAVGNTQMASGAAVANIGYTPVNRAGDLALTGQIGWDSTSHVNGATNQLRLSAGDSIYLFTAADQINPVGQFNVATGAFTWLGSFAPNSLGVVGNATVGGTLGVTGAQTNSSTMQATRYTSTISDSATAPFTAHANQASITCPNVRAASADNALALGGSAAALYALLASPAFTGAPTIGGIAAAKVAAGSYSGSGASALQKTTGFACKFVLIIGRGSGSSSVIAPLTSTSAPDNAKVAGNGVSLAISGMTASRLHASNGFIVDATDGTDDAAYTYTWVAIG